jgi:hypothetical protein
MSSELFSLVVSLEYLHSPKEVIIVCRGTRYWCIYINAIVWHTTVNGNRWTCEEKYLDW